MNGIKDDHLLVVPLEEEGGHLLVAASSISACSGWVLL